MEIKLTLYDNLELHVTALFHFDHLVKLYGRKKGTIFTENEIMIRANYSQF